MPAPTRPVPTAARQARHPAPERMNLKDTLRSAMLHVGRLKDGSRQRAAALLRRLRDGDGGAVTRRLPSGAPLPVRDAAVQARLAADGGCFLAGSFGNAAGTRPYRLHVSTGAVRQPAGPPLLVMLHGCKQTPEDFAAGTRMNEQAEAHGWLVLYPGQPTSANQAGCWNWFNHGDQRRDAGEPSLIAGMTREIVERYGVDADRVYVAGLSAGGAMAATMASTHADLYAACGVHSGLPHAAAHDLMSALSAMRLGPAMPVATAGARLGDGASVPRRRLDGAAMPSALDPAAGLAAAVVAEAEIEAAQQAVPTIVFHGDLDTVVHPCNADGVIAQTHARIDAAALARLSAAAERAGGLPGGHAATRTVHRGADGRVVSEQWLVHGSGHAWSGGSIDGSYTDPLGPDASAEMIRFFAEHPRRRPARRRS